MVFLNIIGCLFFSFSFAETPAKLTKRLAQETAALQHAQWSVYAIYADNGEVIIDYQSNVSLAPASGLKLVTTAAALLELGEDFRFKTEVGYRGTLQRRDLLEGDLVIIGGGDPVLGSDWLPSAIQMDSLKALLLKKVKEAGIRTVKGDVVIDVSVFDDQVIPNDWMWTDIGNYYGAGIWGLNIANNLYHITFKLGPAVGYPAPVINISPKIPGLSFVNHMKTGPEGSGDQGYVYCPPRGNIAYLRGTVPLGFEEFTIRGSMPNPPEWFGHWLKEALILSGIDVQGTVSVVWDPVNKKDFKSLTTIFSPPLKEIIAVTNKRSVNLFAEVLLKMTALQRTGESSTAVGTKVIEDIFEERGIDLSGFRIHDGSGLSRTNMVRTQHFAHILAYMSTTPLADVYIESFSLCGSDEEPAWLKNFGKDTAVEKNARIKTGYIEGVRSHSGYVTSKSGRLITFSMICNNFTTSTTPINNLHEKIIIALAEGNY
ncbi:MAG: D-alanyl-D-alanine carboxypeptidase/D-alanyl-D-alanine-endopeptidase [Candidatus Marinimicrobia bacterium]|nr:D-alanyl-D-alanine carboxypeptidase/D-alanyl-D-alanine-endopeptidase [Candidatus Neomarinimicrobiota bacterium]MDD5583126.1 D-alanyl-D-alanine carboxypeptidase/D-alanyl-D-alanine-endopeptidase [Candidatus Neomarinimicrobiota bacterium]